MKPSIVIELTDKDALLFRKFREHQDTFTTMENAGIFDIRNGKAILNFDSIGSLNDIEANMKLYRKGLAIIPMVVKLHPIDS